MLFLTEEGVLGQAPVRVLKRGRMSCGERSVGAEEMRVLLTDLVAELMLMLFCRLHLPHVSSTSACGLEC